MADIAFHVQDAETNPIGGALLEGFSTEHGNWQALTDVFGNFVAGLAPGHYYGKVSAPGYVRREFSWTFGDPGSVIVGLDLQNHPIPPPDPPIAKDMIDLSDAVIVNSPDVRGWAATAQITEIQIVPGGSVGNTIVSFTKNEGPGCWPDVTPAGWDGPLQYTVWLFLLIDGTWTGAGFIQCWQDRHGCGDSIADYPINWYYPSAWNPMTGHVIQPGETIAYMVTAGSARGGSEAFSVAERSNVVTIQAPAGDSGTFTW